MVRDPKQFLLLHVEKVVLVVMLLLLTLVIYVYEPWSIKVPEKDQIGRLLTDGKKLAEGTRWQLPDVPDYVGKVNTIYRIPWPEGGAPTVLAMNRMVFDNVKKGVVYRQKAPDPPPVLAPAAIYAKADKGQVVVVFQIDDQAQRRKLESTAIQEYQEGLEYNRIEIWRIDKNTGDRVRITPEGWRPRDLPVRYGAPATVYGGPETGPRSMFGEPVYLYAQQRPPDPAAVEAEWRKRMEEEMRRRSEEEKRREEALRKRLEEERKTTTTPTRPTTPATTGPVMPTPVRPMRPMRPTRVPLTVTAPTGWYYYIDQKVDPDAQYEYVVVIFCKNPIYGSTQYSEQVVAEVKSAPATALTDKRIASFKRWYFQGGIVSQGLETATCKVRVFVGGRRDITMTEITQIVAELSGGEDKNKKKKGPTVVEPEGVWVEQNFMVRPGEEIGAQVSKDVGGEKRDIDFGTGCVLVSVQNDVQVVEETHSAMKPGTNGQITTVQEIKRVVRPERLRIAYVDRKGKLYTRWQEVAPSLAKATETPETTE